MRARKILAVLVLSLAALGLGWGSLSALAVTSGDPSPSATGSSQVSFTIDGTASPIPSPSASSGGEGSGGGGSTGGGSSAGGSGSGGGGSTGGGGAACVPSATTPPLGSGPALTPGALGLNTHRPSQGDEVLVTGEGFQAGEKVVLTLYSSPQKLGVVTVRTNGQIYAHVTIPRKTPTGAHTIQATGFQDCKVSAVAFEVVSPSGPGSSLFPWVVWVIAGGGIGIAVIGVLLASALGWLPSLLALGAVGRPVP